MRRSKRCAYRSPITPISATTIDRIPFVDSYYDERVTIPTHWVP